MRYLVSHPFLTGLGMMLVVMAAHKVMPIGPLSIREFRSVPLILFGGAFALLLRCGLDRDDIFWVFLGGMTGLAATMAWRWAG